MTHLPAPSLLSILIDPLQQPAEKGREIGNTARDVGGGVAGDYIEARGQQEVGRRSGGAACRETYPFHFPEGEK